nr:MAG TPA: hypothetical protein [Caudoviricetes sp.]DAT35754.1 MAG TPA: hypothetical protein [Caudoviricetes sp.]DAV30564.1 MAG TPA: hypothetical protein [Caudoviricetes sp.]
MKLFIEYNISKSPQLLFKFRMKRYAELIRMVSVRI